MRQTPDIPQEASSLFQHPVLKRPEVQTAHLRRPAWLSSTASASQPPAFPGTSLQGTAPGISVLRTSSKRVPKEVPAGLPHAGLGATVTAPLSPRRAGGDPVPPGAQPVPGLPSTALLWAGSLPGEPSTGLPVLRHLQCETPD